MCSQPSHQPRRQWRLPRSGATDRTEPSRQKTPINLRREPHQRMAKGDDLLQSRTKKIDLAVVTWVGHGCPPDGESSRRGNHEPPKSGIPKRKKTATHNRLSCKIEYLLRSNHRDSSIASEFFTGDTVGSEELTRVVCLRLREDLADGAVGRSCLTSART